MTPVAVVLALLIGTWRKEGPVPPVMHCSADGGARGTGGHRDSAKSPGAASNASAHVVEQK